MQGRGLSGEKRSYSKDRYFQADVKSEDKLVHDGIDIATERNATLDALRNQLIGGLRASMGYTGSATLEELKTYSSRMVAQPAFSMAPALNSGTKIWLYLPNGYAKPKLRW